MSRVLGGQGQVTQAYVSHNVGGFWKINLRERQLIGNFDNIPRRRLVRDSF